MLNASNLCKNCVLIVNRLVTNCHKLSPLMKNSDSSTSTMWIIGLLSEISLRSIHILNATFSSVKPRLSTFPTWLIITTKVKKGSL